MAKTPEELLRELESAGVLERKGQPVQRAPGPRVPALPESGRGTTVSMLIAAVAVACLGAIPIGQVAIYPITLFVTLVHEACHAVAAIVTGGAVVNLRISPDLSGLTQTSGGSVPLIASAGYVGTAIIGALVFAWPTRFARGVLLALAAAPIAAVMFFHPASLFTALWCVVFACTLILVAAFVPRAWLPAVQIFFGLEIGLNAIRDVGTALLISGSDAHIKTDADLMSSVLFFRPIVWAAFWMLLSALVLVVAILRVVRRAVYSP